jgi:thiamine biosynthesis lipoprotein
MTINTKPATQKRIIKRVMKLMGNRFEISVVTNEENDELGETQINTGVAEIQRIEKLLTTYDADSQTNLVNEQAGIMPVKVDQEVYNLIERSIKISTLTQGAFDITYGSIDKRLWNFDKSMTELPDAATAKKSVRLINYKNILLDKNECTVFLKEKGMRIGFGGIGKGYAAERAKTVMQQNGVADGIVNASGDLTTWGMQPDGKPWAVGIANPNNITKPFSWLNISGMAIATSGNYEKFVMINGKKYSHTIDPKTGLPVHGIKAVTIISPNAEIADAMATPVMIMGIKVGLDMVNQIRGLGCIIIDEDNKVYTSANIHLHQ